MSRKKQTEEAPMTSASPDQMSAPIIDEMVDDPLAGALERRSEDRRRFLEIMAQGKAAFEQAQAAEAEQAPPSD